MRPPRKRPIGASADRDGNGIISEGAQCLEAPFAGACQHVANHRCGAVAKHRGEIRLPGRVEDD